MSQVFRALQQAVALRILRAADRGQTLLHQAVTGQPGKFAVGVIQGQVNFTGAEVDIVIAYPQIQRDLRVTLDEISQSGYQPALGDRRPDIKRNGTGNFCL